MKVYMLRQQDFDDLLARIDRDPSWGCEGGSSIVMNDEERRAHDAAHRFFNYQVRTWLETVKRDG
jgi:hypothetical protein